MSPVTRRPAPKTITDTLINVCPRTLLRLLTRERTRESTGRRLHFCIYSARNRPDLLIPVTLFRDGFISLPGLRPGTLHNTPSQRAHGIPRPESPRLDNAQVSTKP